MNPAIVTPLHLSRKAVIYIRQSSPQQVLTNQESLRLQYALRQRARELGWPDAGIEIIDRDLGMTGASAHQRTGFKELVTQVTLGQVGIILSSEVTRLSRNCSDWFPLLDVCAFKGCLIGDREGMYDPATPNGRLLLGLKGQISELELYTIRARLTAGLLNQAQRGELALALPVGLVRDELGRVHKDPNLEIQHRLELVFATFLQVKSASQVLRFFRQRQLTLPRRARWGEVVWKPATTAAILSVLKNPAYAGAFVYGRSRTLREDPTRPTPQTKRLAPAEWKICVKDKYPAYISWETFEAIRAQLLDNAAEYDRNQTRGIPRPGAALLHGITYCGECGHKLVVQYQDKCQYICNYLRQQHGVPVCQYIPTGPVDREVVAAFFQALAPVELDLYAQALTAQHQADEQVRHAQAQQLERLRYQATLAERQFRRVDPDHRLVAAELERRWEMALRSVQQAEAEQPARSTSVRPLTLTAELKDAFANLGRELPHLWQSETLSQPRRKALLRCLIDKVVLHRLQPDRIQVRIVWRGGATTTLAVTTTVGSLAALSDVQTLQDQVLALTRAGQSDDEIAAHLTARGFRSPQRPTLLPSTVRTIRLKHGLLRQPHQSHPRRIPGFLTVSQVARRLGLTPHWIYDRIYNHTLAVTKDPATGLFLFPDQPDTLARISQLKAGTSTPPEETDENRR